MLVNSRTVFNISSSATPRTASHHCAKEQADQQVAEPTISSFSMKVKPILIVCGLLAFGLQARAQEDYAFRLGPFLGNATAVVGLKFTDNFRNAHTNKESDYWFEESLSLGARAEMAKRHTLNLSSAVTVAQHPEHVEQSAVSRAMFGGELYLDFDPLTFQAWEAFSYETQALNEFWTAGVVGVDYALNDVRLLTTFKPQHIRASADFLHSNAWAGETFGQEVFNPRPRRKDHLHSRLALEQLLRNGNTVYAGLDHFYLDKDGSVSTAVRADAGLRTHLSPVTDAEISGEFTIEGTAYHQITAGIQSGLSPRLKYDLRLGLAVTESPASDKLRFRPVFIGSLFHQLTAYTNHSLQVDIQPSDPFSLEQAVTSPNFTDRYRATYLISHRLTERIFVNFNFSRLQEKTASATINEDSVTWTASPSAGYQFTRKLRTNFTYIYTLRQSDLGSFREYQRNELWLITTYSF
jgi:hypothetical protein